MKDMAIVTTVFPQPENVLLEFFESISLQDDKDFDLVIINDNLHDLDKFLVGFPTLSIVIVPGGVSPAHNREIGINSVKSKGYKYAVFADSDDTFSSNRVRVSKKHLQDYDIVVNDLSTFNGHGIIDRKYFSNRLSNNFEIPSDFIVKKNIFGLSNTAVRLDSVPQIIFHKELLVVDWFLFSILLILKKKAIFTNECETFYRQHEANIVGIGEISKTKVLHTIDTKIFHYEQLIKYDDRFTSLLKETKKLKSELSDQIVLEKIISKTNGVKAFWWELIN